MINAKVCAARIGRRGTKTFGIQAPRVLGALQAMPGCRGFIAAKSYRKLLDVLLPELFSAWDFMGFKEYTDENRDGDYVVCKRPPAGWAKPFIKPAHYDNTITTKWGSILTLISMDHGATAPNGSAYDFGTLDEVKELDPEEVRPRLLSTISGHMSIRRADGVTWGELPEHKSLTLTTDGFYGKKDHKWIEDYKEDALRDDQIAEIIAIYTYLQESYSVELEHYLWELQRKAVLYLNATSLEALALHGPDYYIDSLRNNKPLIFRSAFLNEDVSEIENGFYTLLDASIHGYSDKSNYSRIENLGASTYLSGVHRDCRLDEDWNTNLPLELSIDYGSSYSWCVVMQDYANTEWLLKNFWSETPNKFTDMVQEFCDYYKYHKERVVQLYDDPMGHREKTDSPVPDIDRVIQVLWDNDWEVERMNEHNRYIPHRLKYRVANNILDESESRDQRYPKFRYNKNNAFEAHWSMSKAPLKQGQKEFEKDKSSEKKPKPFPQWQATHLSDCVDNILSFKYVHLIDEGVTFTT